MHGCRLEAQNKTNCKDTNKPPMWFPRQQSASLVRSSVFVATYPRPDPSGSCGFRWPAAASSYRHCGDTNTHTALACADTPPSSAKTIAGREDRFSGCAEGRAPGAGGGPPDSIAKCGCGGFQRGFAVSPNIYTRWLVAESTGKCCTSLKMCHAGFITVYYDRYELTLLNLIKKSIGILLNHH